MVLGSLLLGMAASARGLAVQNVVEAAVQPRLTLTIVAPGIDYLVEDMRSDRQAEQPPFQAQSRLSHEVIVAGRPQMIAMSNRARHAIARGLDCVLADGVLIHRR
jgi:hypothetical protein